MSAYKHALVVDDDSSEQRLVLAGSLLASCLETVTLAGVVHIRPDGTQQLIVGSIPGGGKLHPNGFAMLRDGSFLLANRGDGREGGVWRLHRDGQVEPFLLEVDGITLPRTNFVLLDDQDRVWVSISTVHKPDYEFSATRDDGFIALVDKRGARIVGRGIVWTNEFATDTIVRLDPQTDQMRPFALPSKDVGIRKMIIDAEGRLWYMGSHNGRLGVLE